MLKFRKDLILSKPIKVVRKSTPATGINRKENVERIKLLDCEKEEIAIEEFQEECNNKKETNEDVEPEENNENRDSVSLSLFTNDPDIKADYEFLDKFEKIMKDIKTSKLFLTCLNFEQPIKKQDIV